ncbi:hypothetical protein SynPROS71_02475 [Synechococcus sp. PROS-7-1]|nr:hypothetical protein SynPROS71_02475 [Synechococcus sp. PROS-7-1]
MLMTAETRTSLFSAARRVRRAPPVRLVRGVGWRVLVAWLVERGMAVLAERREGRADE